MRFGETATNRPALDRAGRDVEVAEHVDDDVRGRERVDQDAAVGIDRHDRRVGHDLAGGRR